MESGARNDIVLEVNAPASEKAKHKRAFDAQSMDDLSSVRVKTQKTSHPVHENTKPVDVKIVPGKDYWRTLVCQILGAEVETPDQALYSRLLELNRPESVSTSVVQELQPPLPPKASYQILYKVSCASDLKAPFFLDYPRAVGYGNRPDHFAGQNPVSSIELLEARNPGLSFIIINEFTCCSGKITGGTTSYSTQLKIISHDLVRGLLNVCKSSPRPSLYPKLEVRVETPNPHLWVFRDQEHITSHIKMMKHVIATQLDDVGTRLFEHLNLFLEYFVRHRGEEFALIAKQISNRIISPQHLEYLFVSACSHHNVQCAKGEVFQNMDLTNMFI